VQSVRNFVTNIRELLPSDMTIEDLKQALLRGIFGSDELPRYELRAADWEQIELISAERYRTWEWNYGHSPKFNIRKSGRFPVGTIDVRMDVDRGVIKGIRIYGDFAGQRDIVDLEELLVGVRFDQDALAAVLSDGDLNSFFGSLEKSDFLSLLY
jgi:lipoate-protein ligase A